MLPIIRSLRVMDKKEGTMSLVEETVFEPATCSLFYGASCYFHLSYSSIVGVA